MIVHTMQYGCSQGSAMLDKIVALSNESDPTHLFSIVVQY